MKLISRVVGAGFSVLKCDQCWFFPHFHPFHQQRQISFQRSVATKARVARACRWTRPSPSSSFSPSMLPSPTRVCRWSQQMNQQGSTKSNLQVLCILICQAILYVFYIVEQDRSFWHALLPDAEQAEAHGSHLQPAQVYKTRRSRGYAGWWICLLTARNSLCLFCSSSSATKRSRCIWYYLQGGEVRRIWIRSHVQSSEVSKRTLGSRSQEHC